VLQGMWPVPRQAERQSTNMQRAACHQVQIDTDRYSYAYVSSWEDEETELVDSNSASSSLRHCSYADIVRSGCPSGRNIRQERAEKTPSHQDLPLPLPQRTFIEGNVCGRKCVSKKGLRMRIHVAHMHRDNAVGDGESVETEKASVSEAREYGADAEIDVEVVRPVTVMW